MIGKNTLQIGYEEFIAGMTSGNDTQDGGFSPESSRINIQVAPGVLTSGGVVAERSSSVNGDIIASAGDALFGSVGNDKFLVSSTGRFYTYNGTTLTLRQTGAGSKTYTYANTDMVSFRGDTFTTSENDIARLIQSNLTTPDANWESWWTVTRVAETGGTSLNTGYRHPMVVFENALWIADGNLLHKWDGTVATKAFLTLSSEQAITALSVDPSTGKMMIAINEGFNASDTKPYISKMLFFNGFSNKPDRAVIIDDMVTAIYPLSGVVYICYGASFGYWNGTGIVWLRTLKNVTLDATTLIYKHKITSVGNTIYIADGTSILAYGEVIAGKKAFCYVADVAVLGLTVSAICYLRGVSATTLRELGIFSRNSGITYVHSLNINSTSVVTNGTFYSKKYRFPRPVQIRGVYVEYGAAVPNGVTPGTISLVNIKNNGSFNTASLENTTGTTIYEDYTKIVTNVKMRTVQLIYTFTSSVTPLHGIKRFVIDYDVVE